MASASAPVMIPPDDSNVGRISMLAFKIVVGTFFALSLIFAAVRTTIRIRQHRRVYSDDIMLMFACVTLIGATILVFVITDTIYWDEQLILDPSPAVLAQALAPNFFNRILWYQQTVFSFLTLTWTTIFAVKICFLLFFRQMVQRLPGLIIFWKVVFGITLLSYCVCACGVFISCPHFGLAALKCAQGPGFTKNLALAATEISLDLATDLLIISIPIFVLSKVKIDLHQKFAVAVFLCLSLCMMMVAIVRVSGLHIAGTNIDVQWEVFWQEVEATISVIMISITAFRSLLGMKAAEAREAKDRAWYFYRRKLLTRRLRKSEEDDLNMDRKLPSIPGATMTGLRTFIRGSRGPSTMMSKLSKAETLLEEQPWTGPMQNDIITSPPRSTSITVSPEHSVSTE